jgi:hypothetical protein
MKPSALETNRSGVIGFAMYPSKPRARILSRSPTIANAVTAMMGTPRSAGISLT